VTYIRYPQLIGDQIVFVADDDVWRVGADGGRAERLSSDRVAAARPKLSRDGTQVAWASRRDGNPEIYVAPTSGGPATRLTYWNAMIARPLGWTADGRVVAATYAGQAFRSRTWAWALPTDGSPGERLPYGPVNGVARRPDGATVLQSSNHREPPMWKRYRGGTAARLWIDRTGSGDFELFLTELRGQVADPVWVGDRLVFVSDHEGHGNVYSALADGSDLRRHTDHSGQYARDLGGDLEGGSTRLVYHRAGELFRLDSFAADSQPVPVPVELPGVRAGRQPTVIPVSDALGDAESADVDATGRASVVEVRGTIQWLPHRDGPARAIGQAPGVRNRLPRVVPNAEDPWAAVWVTDGDGVGDSIELRTTSGTQRLFAVEGRVLELVVSPDGTRLAYATHDGKVVVAALDGSSPPRTLEDVTELGDSRGLAFSPDSAWLAWSRPRRANLRSIRLAELATGAVHDVTEERFVDTEPVFTADGRYLAFLSARTFDPVYDQQSFDLGFAVSVRPYVVPLTLDTPSPFDPELAGRGFGEQSGGNDGGESAEGTRGAGGAGGTVSVRVDPAGLADRAVVVPVAAGLISGLAAGKDALLWLEQPITGELGTGLPEGAERPRPSLHRWDLAERSADTIVDELDWFRVSGDGKRLLVRDKGALRVLPSDHKVSGDAAKKERIDVDLTRVRLEVDPVAEWRQMTVETWRLMRDHFWIADMGGVDWEDVLTRYLPVVERTNSRDDLSEVLWEMIGELGASHAYERIEYPPAPDGRAAAFLGADLSRGADGRWRVDRVLPGDSSVPASRSPLLASAVDVQPGDVLVSIGGVPVPANGPGPLLAGRAGKPVAVTVERGGAERTVVIRPTADETPIRYQAWVADRRARTHELSEGRIGYVHIPDMVSLGWAEFNRDLRHEVLYDALLVDTRDNGGGHVSELVIERLARKQIAGSVARYAQPEQWPTDAPRGPLLSLANQHAGSDGDIVNQTFRELGLGRIVGVRTWGGVIGIDGRYALVDGTVVTQPRYSFWFRDAGWTVENYGVDPDVEVHIPPQAWAAGEDPQLAEGVRLLLEQLQTFQPVQGPSIADRPNRAAPLLPPR